VTTRFSVFSNRLMHQEPTDQTTVPRARRRASSFGFLVWTGGLPRRLLHLCRKRLAFGACAFAGGGDRANTTALPRSRASARAYTWWASG
jgi:hypothetical protein